jgi:hypothetical protein
MHESTYSGKGKFQLKIFYVSLPTRRKPARLEQNTQKQYGNELINNPV